MELTLAMSSLYAAIGGTVALSFVLFGVHRIDPASHGAWLARLLWLPGLALLWPIVLIRWVVLERRNGQAR